MRLLQDDGHGDLRLVEHTGDRIPRYAILSHTWGADSEEVTFTDLMQGTGKNKVGYKKIEFCGKQAASDGLGHFWVDTCCIDKTSSAELTEAINSMFRWYRHAAKCYVYLSDVSTNDHNQNSPSFQSWEAAFQNSRWFTRGWTLQELIAPPLVEFFSLEGNRLGDKKSLERQVHEVTGVAVRALEGDTLLEFSVAERMSWAEKRETRREEDKAYSLLGIFNVHIPLIYGEGKENALRRLREEIDSRLPPTQISTQRASQLPQPSPPAPSAIIPFRRDRDFVERPVLGDLSQRAAEPGARVGLVGLGGVGKTQLVIEYAYRVRDEDPQTWVLWVHASSAARFQESYKSIAQRLQLNGWNEPKVDILGMVHGWLSNENNGRWIMVVDNADDASVLFEPWTGEINLERSASASARYSLADYLSSSPNGSIVMTTRNRNVAEGLIEHAEDILDVRPMVTEEAVALLMKRLKKQEPDLVRGDLIDLAQELDCMPLAMSQAAAYVNQRAPRVTVSKYLDELRWSDYGRVKLLQVDIRDPRRDGQASNSILTTWYMSFEYLRRKRDSAARLLSLMSLFDREGIPDYLLRDRYQKEPDGEHEHEHKKAKKQGARENNVIDLEDDIATLRAYDLIGVGAVSDQLFDMHRLVQFSTKTWLEMHGELQRWQERYIDILGAAFPVGDYANWATCQALFPHVEAMEMHRVRSTDHLQVWARVLYNGAWYAMERGQYGLAERMARASLEVCQEVLGLDDIATLNSTTMLALVLRYRGQYKQAEEMNRWALAGMEKELGVNHPDTLMSMNNLASVLQDQGQYEQAEEMNQRALTGREKELGVNHPNTLTSVSNLASVLQYQGQYEQAEEMYQRALAGSEKELGVNHPNTLISVSNLASVLQDQGQYEQAEEMNRRALAGYEKELGVNHPNTLTSVSNLALVLQHQGQYEQAEEMQRRALAGREKELSVNHPKTLSSVSNLALVLQYQGQYKQAEEMNRRALTGMEKELGVNHRDTLMSVYCLAHLLSASQNYHEALNLYQRAIVGYEKLLGSEHPKTVACQKHRASLVEKISQRQ